MCECESPLFLSVYAEREGKKKNKTPPEKYRKRQHKEGEGERKRKRDITRAFNFRRKRNRGPLFSPFSSQYIDGNGKRRGEENGREGKGENKQFNPHSQHAGCETTAYVVCAFPLVVFLSF